MSLLFNRIAIVNVDGREFKSPPFSIDFEVEFKENGIGASKLKLYNPAPETVDKCRPSKKEKVLVSIDAGYVDEYGRVYLGEIFEVKESFKRPDRVLEIGLVDVSSSWVKFSINQQFTNQPASSIIKSISSIAGIELGKVDLVKDPVIPKIYINTFENGVRELSKLTDSNYYVKYGALQFDKEDKQIEKAYVLNYKSGLIGSPELIVKNDKKKKQERYKIRALFNYKIQNRSTLIVETGKDQKEMKLKVLCGKHTFSSFGNSFTEVEAILL